MQETKRIPSVMLLQNVLVLCACMAASTYTSSLAIAQSDESARGVIFDEQHVIESEQGVLASCAALSPEQQYVRLKNWVLPGDTHESFRISAIYLPLNAPSSGLSTIESGPFKDRFASATLALVETAKSLGQLEHLQKQIDSANARTDRDHCAKLLLSFLTNQALGNQQAASLQLEAFFRELIDNRELMDRAGDMMVIGAVSAYNDAAHSRLGLDFLSGILQAYKVEFDRPAWMRHLWAVHAQTARMVALEDGEAPTQDTFENHQWHQASRLTAFENGSGFPEAHWVMQSGSAMSKSSLGDDFLFFASPLTGSYDVEVDATAFDYRESQLVLGGIWTGLVYTHADYALGNLRGEVKRLPLPKRLSDTTSHGFVHTRLQVRDGLTNVFLNGHPVHSYQAPSSAFPWLAVRSMYRVHGGVQDLRITGNPVVPDEIDLIDSPKLLGWYDYYQPPKRESNRLGVWAYQKQLDEAWITAPKDVSLQPGSQAERQLVYARPMMEDGLIEYEYWYEPGQWNASPTLGWNAIVLGSDGVRVHRISDGRFGAIGRESVQHSSESRAVAAPQLVAGAWNRVRLQIEENQLSIFVNQELVLEQPVKDEWQHRRFGLFYLADESGLRVRNIRWAGQWPKEVPTLGDQQLARYENRLLVETEDELQHEFKHQFGMRSLLDGHMAMIEGDPNSDLQPTDEGLVISRKARPGYSSVRLAPALEVAGDFDFEVRFDQLKYEVPAGKIGYVRVGVDATEEARERAVIQLGGNREGDQVVQCMRGTVLKGADRSHYFEMQPADADSGRLRFSRRGSTIYYLYAENDSSQFRLLAEQEYVGANILQAGLQFGVHMQGPGGRVSVRIREVSVRAAGLEGPALRDSNATLVRLNKEREDLPERYAEDFADFPLAESTYLVWANGNTPASDSKGVLIHAAGHSSWSSSGFGIPNQYTGDFDIKYRFDDPNLLHPEERKHTQVYLQLEYDDDENTQLSAMLTRSAAGTYYSQAQVRSRPAGSYKYTNLATVPYSDPDFLRILRRGEEVYFLAGNEGRQEEFLMASAPIGDAPLNRYGVRVMLHTGAAEGESTVYARSLTVHAESEVVPEAIRRAAPLTNPVQPDESLPARLLNSLREIFP